MQTEELYVHVVAVEADMITVIINGTRYEYRPNINGYAMKSKLDEMVKHSPGKAIQYIKNNAVLLDKYTI